MKVAPAQKERKMEVQLIKEALEEEVVRNSNVVDPVVETREVASPDLQEYHD